MESKRPNSQVELERKGEGQSKAERDQRSGQQTCMQRARLTLEPNAVLTARGERPRSLKSLEKDWVSSRRGRSSAITTQLRTHERFSPRAWRDTDTRPAMFQFYSFLGNVFNVRKTNK